MGPENTWSADKSAWCCRVHHLNRPTHHHASSAACRVRRSLQLRRWFRKLASRLVSGKEGVVLQSARQGLSESRRWLCDFLQAVRLQCWFRKLDGGLVRGKEGLVLQ